MDQFSQYTFKCTLRYIILHYHCSATNEMTRYTYLVPNKPFLNIFSFLIPSLKGGLGLRSREPAPSSGRKRLTLRVGNATGGEWAGGCARLKDGRRHHRRRPAAAAPEVTLRPAGSARSHGPLSPSYHEASGSPHAGLDLLGGRSRL